MERVMYSEDGQLDTVEAYVVFGTKITVRKMAYLYDKTGRQTELREVVGGEGRSVVYYYYDRIEELEKQDVFSVISQPYRERMSNLRGRLVAKVAVNYVNGRELKVGEVYSYDADGRVTCKEQAISGYPMFQENLYTYDVHGKLTHDDFYYAGDNILKRYNYDRLGRLASVEQGKLQPGNTYVFTMLSSTTYNDLGELSGKDFSTITPDFQTTYDYDILGRITDITSGPSGTALFSESIRNAVTDSSGYTVGGSVGSVNYTYAVGGSSYTHNEHYNYDDLNRLASGERAVRVGSAEAGTDPFNYSYDILGRFTSKEEGASNLTDYTYYSGVNVDGNNVLGTSRLKYTSKNASTGKNYLYDRIGNCAVDFTRNMVAEYDWRDMPIAFRFYTNLEKAGLTGDIRGNYMGDDLYGYIDSKVDDGTLTLRESVIMLYNADGDRVCKMEVQE